MTPVSSSNPTAKNKVPEVDFSPSLAVDLTLGAGQRSKGRDRTDRKRFFSCWEGGLFPLPQPCPN